MTDALSLNSQKTTHHSNRNEVMNALKFAVLDTCFRVALSKKTCAERALFTFPRVAAAVWKKQNTSWVCTLSSESKENQVHRRSVCMTVFERSLSLWTLDRKDIQTAVMC